MLETLLSLKNNKLSSNEPSVLLMRRLQKQISHELRTNHQIDHVDALRISLIDLLDPSRKGRYWLVGSGWIAPTERSKQEKADALANLHREDDQMSRLARKHRMNTPLKRGVFSILLTCEDYLDAFEKILHLDVKGKQEREIVYVLLYCAQQETDYNPFYAHLADKFCNFHSTYKFTFKVSMWDFVKKISPDSEPEPDLGANTLRQRVRCLAGTFGHLILTGALPINSLKAMLGLELVEPVSIFFSYLMARILAGTPEQIRNTFSSLDSITQRKKRELLRYFSPCVVCALIDRNTLTAYMKRFRRGVGNLPKTLLISLKVDVDHLKKASKLAYAEMKNRRSAK